MESFRCGHPCSAENTVQNGNKNGACRQCHTARNRARYAANLDQSRKSARDRTMKHRRAKGVMPGHRNERKAACPANHPYDDENTYVCANEWRQCKQCRRDTTTAYYHAKRSNGGSHTQSEWLALCVEHGSRCVSCGEGKPLTRDHVIPVTLGGSNSIENIQPLCRECNSAKGNRNTTDYRPQLAVAV